MPARALRTAVSALLGLVFAAGLAGEAYGVHDCSHHHPGHAPRTASGGPGAVAPPGSGQSPAAGQVPLQAPPDGPCTCVGSCHAASVALDTALSPVLPSSPDADLGLSAPAPDDRLPRLRAYLLPFANGPPLRA